MDRDLIEKLLSAQVLTLAYAIDEAKKARGAHGSFSYAIKEAIEEIKKHQANIIQSFEGP